MPRRTCRALRAGVSRVHNGGVPTKRRLPDRERSYLLGGGVLTGSPPLCAESRGPAAERAPYTYCMLHFCPPLHDVTCCEYHRFLTHTPLWQDKSRRRKDGTDVGTT